MLTVLGIDRPGLVDELAATVERHGGNWERSRMAHLGRRFAGIVEVTVPDTAVASFDADLVELRATTGLHVTSERTDDDPSSGDGPASGDDPHPRPGDVSDGGSRLVVELVGTDRPGLVHAVAGALADVGANIEELETATTEAPMAGGTLFEARATVTLPVGVGDDDVRRRLEAIADRLMVDIELGDPGDRDER